MLIADLSSNQGSVDFARLKKAGVAGVWMKVTEGATWEDPDWAPRARAARKAGLRVGGYHFARPDHNSATVEAHHFVEKLGVVGRRDLKPILDFETEPGIESWARTFNHVVRDLTGLIPGFYSYPAFIQQMRPLAPIGNGLWLAAYGRNDGTDHPFDVPEPWRKVIAHQFSSKCHLPGVDGPVDLSHAPRLRGVLAHPILGL